MACGQQHTHTYTHTYTTTLRGFMPKKSALTNKKVDAKELCISAKEPYIYPPNEICISAKEPCHLSKKGCVEKVNNVYTYTHMCVCV